LVDATSLTSHPLAKCLASVQVNLASDCAISLTPLSSGGSYVPGIWADATSVDTYAMLRECPVTTGAAVAGGDLADDQVAAMETAFENFVYGSDKPIAATLAFPATGKVTVTIGANPLTYAITKVRVATWRCCQCCWLLFGAPSAPLAPPAGSAHQLTSPPLLPPAAACSPPSLRPM
jgi:hypothetical protein